MVPRILIFFALLPLSVIAIPTPGRPGLDKTSKDETPAEGSAEGSSNAPPSTAPAPAPAASSAKILASFPAAQPQQLQQVITGPSGSGHKRRPSTAEPRESGRNEGIKVSKNKLEEEEEESGHLDAQIKLEEGRQQNPNDNPPPFSQRETFNEWGLRATQHYVKLRNVEYQVYHRASQGGKIERTTQDGKPLWELPGAGDKPDMSNDESIKTFMEYMKYAPEAYRIQITAEQKHWMMEISQTRGFITLTGTTGGGYNLNLAENAPAMRANLGKLEIDNDFKLSFRKHGDEFVFLKTRTNDMGTLDITRNVENAAESFRSNFGVSKHAQDYLR